MQCIHINSVQVFIREVQVNKWEIVCATYLLKDDDFSVHTKHSFGFDFVVNPCVCITGEGIL